MIGKLLNALALYGFRSNRKSWEPSPRSVVTLTVLPDYGYELRAVEATDFKHLDLFYYDNHQRRLEERHFRFLNDLEDGALENVGGACRTFMRFFVDRDGFVLANIYHLQPNWLGRLKGARSCKVVEFETQFMDGSWICTSNAESANSLTLPGEIQALYLPSTTTLEHLLNLHGERVEQHLASRQGVLPVNIHSTEDLIRAQCQQQGMKVSYRNSPMEPEPNMGWNEGEKRAA